MLFLQPEPEIHSFVFHSLIIDIRRELSDFNKDVTTPTVWRRFRIHFVRKCPAKNYHVLKMSLTFLAFSGISTNCAVHENRETIPACLSLLIRVCQKCLSPYFGAKI